MRKIRPKDNHDKPKLQSSRPPVVEKSLKVRCQQKASSKRGLSVPGVTVQVVERICALVWRSRERW